MPRRLFTFAFLLLIASVATAHSNDGLALEWHPVSDGLFSLVLINKDKSVTICMTGQQGLESAPMAPTDTYVTNSFGSGPILLRPFCAIEVYDEHGERVGRGLYDGLSLLEVEMKPPGYVLKLGLGDRISLDRTYRDKPFRTVVRLPIYAGGNWKVVILETK